MKKGHGSKFGRKKEVVLACLAAGKSDSETAQAAGVDLSTVKRWKRMPEFQAELLQIRRDAMTQASARVQHNAVALVSLGLKLASQETTPASVRAHLILGFLDRGNQSVDRDDILVRLEALERAAEQAKNNH